MLIVLLATMAAMIILLVTKMYILSAQFGSECTTCLCDMMRLLDSEWAGTFLLSAGSCLSFLGGEHPTISFLGGETKLNHWTKRMVRI